jgi:hypothetical protein
MSSAVLPNRPLTPAYGLRTIEYGTEMPIKTILWYEGTDLPPRRLARVGYHKDVDSGATRSHTNDGGSFNSLARVVQCLVDPISMRSRERAGAGILVRVAPSSIREVESWGPEPVTPSADQSDRQPASCFGVFSWSESSNIEMCKIGSSVSGV